MKTTNFLACALLLAGVATTALAEDPAAAIDALNAKLNALGPAKVEGTDKLGDKTAPVLFFGTRRINGNFDAVDSIKKSTGAAATIFVRDGDEFVRVSTNVLTTEGKRGVGTQLKHNPAYEAMTKGEARWCGVIDVLGTQLDSCYDSVKDASGKLVALTYVGFKK
jgi:hypothetical protein